MDESTEVSENPTRDTIVESHPSKKRRVRHPAGGNDFMSEDEKYKVPEGTKGDVVESLVKGVVSAVPVAGGFLAELLQIVVVPPLEKRKAEWMNGVAEGLKELEQKVAGFDVEHLKENDQFISTIVSASQIAIKNHQKEKLEALRNAVLNVAVGSGLTEDTEAIYLSLIDRYTAWHLRILRLFQNPLQLGAQKGLRPENYYIGGSRAQFLETYYPDMRGQREFYDIAVSDLHAQGLLGVQDLQTMVTGHGMFQM
jgi:hypothetical protein